MTCWTTALPVPMRSRLIGVRECLRMSLTFGYQRDLRAFRVERVGAERGVLHPGERGLHERLDLRQ